MVNLIYEKWYKSLLNSKEFQSFPLLQNKSLCINIIDTIFSKNKTDKLLLASLLTYMENHYVDYRLIIKALKILKEDIIPPVLKSRQKENEVDKSSQLIKELIDKIDLFYKSPQPDKDKTRWDRLLPKLDLLGATILELDDQFKIQKINSSVEHFFGYKKIELINEHINKLFSSTSQPIIENALDELKTKQRYKIDLELEAEGRSGRRFQASLKITPLNGQLYTRNYSVFIQKSEYIKYAKDSSKLLETVLENIKEGIIIWESNPGQRILFINKSFEAITGYSRHELINQPLYKFVKASNNKEKNILLNDLNSPKSIDKEIYIITQSSDNCKVRLTTKTMHSEFNQTYIIIGTITPLKDNGLASPKEKKHYCSMDEVVARMPNLAFITNIDFAIQNWNQTAEKEFNLKSKTKKTRDMFNLLSLPDPNRLKEEIHKNIEEQNCFSGKISSYQSNKSDKYYDIQIIPFKDNSKQLLFWMIQDNSKKELYNFKIIKQNASLKFIENFSRIINRNLELESLTQFYTKELFKIFNFDYLSFFLPYDLENHYFQLYYLFQESKESFPTNRIIDMSRDLNFQRLMQNQKALVHSFPEEFENSKQIRSDLSIPGCVKEIVNIPIVLEKNILGILIIGTSEKGSFQKDDLKFLRQISNHLAIALKNNTYFKFAELQKKKFFIINSIFNAPQTENTILHICKNTLSGLLDLLNCQSGGLYKSTDGENWHKILLKQTKKTMPHSLKIPKTLLDEHTISWETISSSLNDKKLVELKNLNSSGIFSWESSPSFGYIAFLSLENQILNRMNGGFVTTLIEDILKQMVVALDQIILFEKVKMAENEWETTFNSVNIGLVVIDENLQIIRTNSAFMNLYKYDYADLIGKTCRETFYSPATEDDPLSGDSKNKKIEQFETEYFDSKIDKIILRIFYPFYNLRGDFKGGIFTIQDVTEKHYQREKITYLSKFPENNPNIILSLDEHGNILYINPTMHNTMKALNVSQSDISQLLPQNLKSIFDELKKTKSKAIEVEHNYRDRLFQYIIYHPTPNDNFYLYGMDITEKVNLQKQLIQTERIRALGEMAAGVAHDFNNLLATILGRTQLLLIKSDRQEMLRELKVIEKAATEGGQIVRRLQEVTREKRERNFQALDANELIKESLIFAASKLKISTQLKNKKVHLYTDLKDNLVVKGDPVELKEVFTNIILNAFDAMPNGGKLYIKSNKLNKNNIKIIFRDTGNGMSEEIKNKIFNPFFTTKGDKGTGLGLSIAYKNITTHGGSIKVHSQINRGSTFTIILPSTVDKLKAKDKKKSYIKDKISEANLLIVDDEPELLETMAEILRLKFKIVEIAPDGNKALQKTKKHKFDIILTDLGMPEMSGWELARKIKDDLPDSNIILVTGWGDQAKEELKHHPYVDEVLPKPYLLNELLEKINIFFKN